MVEAVSQQTGHFVHHINPVLAELFGMKLWYYGLTYSVGFLGVYLWFDAARRRLGWSRRDVYDLTILLALSVLVLGRAFEIVFYEWGYYRQHPSQVISYWRGGMASHGVLLGGVVGTLLFSRLRRKSFLEVAEEMVIPGAFLMGVGRIGNFIDGQIVGAVTDVWWAVKFPNAEGFRHPVTLYDSLKNFLMIPLLLLVRRVSPPGQGMLLAQFVFWYGFGRLFVDYFREYPTHVLGIGTGQYFNLLMSVVGLGLMIWSGKSTRRGLAPSPVAPARSLPRGLWLRRLAFGLLLLFPLIIPTDWTQGNIKQPEELSRGAEPAWSDLGTKPGPAGLGQSHGRVGMGES